jgi:hypothetical protein
MTRPHFGQSNDGMWSDMGVQCWLGVSGRAQYSATVATSLYESNPALKRDFIGVYRPVAATFPATPRDDHRAAVDGRFGRDTAHGCAKDTSRRNGKPKLL